MPAKIQLTKALVQLSLPVSEDDDVASIVRKFIAEFFDISVEKITDDLDIFADLLPAVGVCWIQYNAYFFYSSLTDYFRFDAYEPFDLDRHCPNIKYPGRFINRILNDLFYVPFMPICFFEFLWSLVVPILIFLRVPPHWLLSPYEPPTGDLPRSLPREYLPDNYFPLTVGYIVRAVETGKLVVDYGDESKSPRDV